MVPIVAIIGICLFTIKVIHCRVNRNRSSNAAPGHQRVLFVSVGSRVTSPPEIAGEGTNPTSLPPNTAVTTAEQHGLSAHPSKVDARAPPASTAGMLPSSSLHHTEPQTVQASEACLQTNFAYRPPTEPPPRYTPEDTVRGAEEDLYPPATEQLIAPPSYTISSNNWQVDYSQ